MKQCQRGKKGKRLYYLLFNLNRKFDSTSSNFLRCASFLISLIKYLHFP